MFVGVSLEDVIGRDAVIKLRDWLLAAYPIDSPDSTSHAPASALDAPPHSTTSPRDRQLDMQASARAAANRRGKETQDWIAGTQGRVDKLLSADPNWPPTYAVEDYRDDQGRTWWRIVGYLSREVVEVPIRQGRASLRLDGFASWDEACRRHDKLVRGK